VLIAHTGPEAVVTVLAKINAKLGLISSDVKLAAEGIEKLI
jgi:uncharacterized protein